MEEDPWKNRSEGMRCRTCMFYAAKVPIIINLGPMEAINVDPGELRGGKKIGRCRRHAPTMNGYPVVFEDDWCGDHKLDETKV